MVVVVDGFNGVRGSDLYDSCRGSIAHLPHISPLTSIMNTRARTTKLYVFNQIPFIGSLSMAGQRVVSISSCWGRRPCPEKWPGYTLMPVANTPVYVHYHVVATTTDTSGDGSVVSAGSYKADSYPRGYRFRARVSSSRPRI